MKLLPVEFDFSAFLATEILVVTKKLPGSVMKVAHLADKVPDRSQSAGAWGI